MLLNEKRLFATTTDRVTYQLLVEYGVLTPYEPGRVGGVQICDSCADGLRPHYKEHIRDMCFQKGGERTFFHTFAGNGNPMRFAYLSPLSGNCYTTHQEQDVWGSVKTMEIAETLDMADELNIVIDEMRLAHHWPCKAALKRNISLIQSIDLVVRGKMRIKHQFHHLKVGAELFVDWGTQETSQKQIKVGAYMCMLQRPEFSGEYTAMREYFTHLHTLPIIRRANNKKSVA